MVDVGPIVYDDDWEEWSADKGSFADHMVAGSIAGLAEHLIMYPVDTFKVRGHTRAGEGAASTA